MNEKLLQYLWNFKIFTSFNFHDTEGNEVEILDFGKWNYDSGPDFLFGKIFLTLQLGEKVKIIISVVKLKIFVLF